MTSDGAPEYLVEQDLYYPAASSYGYYCTGFEPLNDWDDHQAVFGLDGAEIQFTGVNIETLPVYINPTYGYGESPYNPYNPYIPGAMIGVDGSYVGMQPYYTIPPYQNTVSSSGYFPAVVHTSPDVVASSSMEPLTNTGSSTANDPGVKHMHSLAPAALSLNSSKPASSPAYQLTGALENARVNTATSKRPMTHQSTSSGGPFNGTSFPMPKSANASATLQEDNLLRRKLLPLENQVKLSFPMGGGLSDFGTTTNKQNVNDGPWSKLYYRRVSNDAVGNQDPLGEQNRGPRTNRLKNQFIVKGYSTKAENINPDGNIIISADQYNRDEFLLDYNNAKFFVIKSYSEDDVHKSIKYNVWSSTPNGNKKLNAAYDEAQKIAAGNPRGCPIFLFFSVNASGQFCGVAEMTGAVDFDKDMDFWQQDKWSGSFPVKWHMIKDVHNFNFRHIILENNEHKPVTNSRDTQEVMYKQGMEMLRIFKNFPFKTSLLDDFMYYENRQKIMFEDRSRMRPKSRLPAFFPPNQLNFTFVQPLKEENGVQQNNPNGPVEITKSPPGQPSSTTNVDNSSAKKDSVKETKDDVTSTLRIGSLTINPKASDQKSPVSTSVSTPVDVVTVGSMPVKVNGTAKSSGFLTVGTIPLDPRALNPTKMGVDGPQKST